MKKKILLVEDEEPIRDSVFAYLTREGYKVEEVTDGADALKEFTKFKPDLVVLDLMLPNKSGEEICEEIRKTSDIPIIMTTAKTDLDDKLHGFDLGADDYIPKPFSPRELVARVNALIKRAGNEKQEDTILKFKHLTIDKLERKVIIDKKDVPLTNIEYKILILLASNPEKVFSRTELVEKVLGDNYKGYERTIDSHIKNLRNKLKAVCSDCKCIHTLYGLGYKFNCGN